MAKIRLKLDTRYKPKNGYYPITVYVIEGKKQIYLSFGKMTLSDYHAIFEKNSFKAEHREFRMECENELHKVEKMVSEMKVFDTKILRSKYSDTVRPKEVIYSLLVSEMFDVYMQNSTHLSLRSIAKMKVSKNCFVSYTSDLTLLDIDKKFLQEFDKCYLGKGRTVSYINGLHRNLRTVINYYRHNLKVVPAEYCYPYGKGEYKICDYFPKKQVLSNDEIMRFLAFRDFESTAQEYARNVWELLYVCNGINLVDLVRLRWDDRRGNNFVFFRKKTLNTRKNHKEEIVVPITERVQSLLNKIGCTDSPFVIGKLKNSYTEQYFENKIHKYRGQINRPLREISNLLKLSTPLTTSTARDCYATVLSRNGVSRDNISVMLNHSSLDVTKHYLASLNMEDTFVINANLI